MARRSFSLLVCLFVASFRFDLKVVVGQCMFKSNELSSRPNNESNKNLIEWDERKKADLHFFLHRFIYFFLLFFEIFRSKGTHPIYIFIYLQTRSRCTSLYILSDSRLILATSELRLSRLPSFLGRSSLHNTTRAFRFYIYIHILFSFFVLFPLSCEWK